MFVIILCFGREKTGHPTPSEHSPLPLTRQTIMGHQRNAELLWVANGSTEQTEEGATFLGPLTSLLLSAFTGAQLRVPTADRGSAVLVTQGEHHNHQPQSCAPAEIWGTAAFCSSPPFAGGHSRVIRASFFGAESFGPLAASFLLCFTEFVNSLWINDRVNTRGAVGQCSCWKMKSKNYFPLFENVIISPLSHMYCIWCLSILSKKEMHIF